MKIKKLVSIVALSAILIASIGIESYAEDITVRLDGEDIECAVPARIENGRTMVPMRAIFEAFGMEVTWNNDEKSVTATNGEDTVKLTVGENVLYVNGEEITMDTAPYIADDTTLVPVRAVSEGLDAEVEWNDEKRRVEITTAEYAANKDAWKDNTGVINVTDMTVTGEGVSVEENVVRITAGGDFTVVGENDNVMIHVNTKYKVKLRLEGVKMSNPSNPVIFFENSEKSLITISKGTENYITDGEEYAHEAKAAVFSNDDIEIKGEGTLYVTSKAHHALASDDDIKIEEGTMVLTSEKKDGIHANNTIKITGGDISVTAFGDGIQSEEDIVIEGGNISVTTNGTVAQSSNNPWGGGMPQGGRGGRDRQNQFDWDNGQVTPPTGEMTPPQGDMPTGEMTPPEGIEGMTPPEGGRPMGEMTPPEGMEGMMPPEDGNQVQTEDEATATKGIKAEINISITGGKITVDAADHAIHCAATISITGGEMELSSKAGKGISAHGDVVIDDGEIRVIKASEGLESKANFTINGGKIEVNATDDGINAGGTGGRDVANRRDAEAQTGHDLIINGGTIFVNAQGDGLDANGRMIINGGDIVVEGPTNNGNGSLDSGGVIRVNGGTVIALGASGMAEVPDNESGQPAFRLVTDQNIAQNTTITIKSESGDVLYSYTTKKTGNSIVFSSPQLKVGDKYTVTIGESVHTIEMTSNVTSVGNGGMGGFGGGRRW